ncbi:NAD(P)/FAD-dependent oxidoreductase [Candidatus Wolfebacteria bacterium]|nr:NAD(P)/FAD-dependent oxidoreductase [Candidatus Wolfebacteria bacterium]
MKRIVILGGGFGGVNAYLELTKLFRSSKKKAEITLVDEKDYFDFLPLIHEVATGSLASSGVIRPFRQIIKEHDGRFLQGKVLEVNLDKQIVSIDQYPLEINEPPKVVSLAYDFLILGLGSETEYYDIPGAAEYSFTLKTLTDARKIKYLLVDRFEQAEAAPEEEKKKLLCFVIVGGGPTGVELAGEIADLINDELYRAFPNLRGISQVQLIQRAKTLVPHEEEWFQKQTLKILKKKMKVKVLLDQRVLEITADGVQIKGNFIPCRNVFWTAGVKAKNLKIKSKKPLEYEEKTRRIKVQNTLNSSSYPNLFMVGDQAWICDKENHQPYPMRAQFAMREGRRAARNIWRMIDNKPLQEFHWQDKGFLLSLGKGVALARVLGFRLQGPLAWLIYRLAYLINIIGFRAKLTTGMEWLINLFLARDIWKPK